MRYITGIQALNLVCPDDTCGDWHVSAIQWNRLNFSDTETRFFGDYGIYITEHVPQHDGSFHAATHIRALLDLLEDGNFATAQGMNKDFICNDSYDETIFLLVSKMSVLPNWEEINDFMGKEYGSKWLHMQKGD